MLENTLSKEEMEALLQEQNEGNAEQKLDSRLEPGEKDKLLHAAVRNQLRLLRMIDELQAEVQSLRAHVFSLTNAGAAAEAAVSVEPLPLPFMERKSDEAKSAPPPQLSRKERHKKLSLW